eukprot:3980271-Amphidinium_carterae.1
MVTIIRDQTHSEERVLERDRSKRRGNKRGALKAHDLQSNPVCARCGFRLGTAQNPAKHKAKLIFESAGGSKLGQESQDVASN